VVSLQEVSNRLGVSPEVGRALLQKWIDKGRVERLPPHPACLGCSLCDSSPRELYRWRQPEPEGSAAATDATP
jgi:hypothetical protein